MKIKDLLKGKLPLKVSKPDEEISDDKMEAYLQGSVDTQIDLGEIETGIEMLDEGKIEKAMLSDARRLNPQLEKDLLKLFGILGVKSLAHAIKSAIEGEVLK